MPAVTGAADARWVGAVAPLRSRITQSRAGAAAECRNAVDCEHDAKGDQQHRNTEHGNRRKIAALIEVIDQNSRVPSSQLSLTFC